MAAETSTVIVPFGAAVSAAQDRLYIEVDQSRHMPVPGQYVDKFLPGDFVYFLVWYDPSITVLRVTPTDGVVHSQGLVIRDADEELLFKASDQEHMLRRQPLGAVSVDWMGRVSQLQINGRMVTAPAAPCRGVLRYRYRALSYFHHHPSLRLQGDDETYRVDLVVDYREAT